MTTFHSPDRNSQSISYRNGIYLKDYSHAKSNQLERVPQVSDPVPATEVDSNVINTAPLVSSDSDASHFVPWLMPLLYFLGLHIVLPFYFGRITVIGQEHLPTEGPVIFAPTHRARWDAILVPYATGRHVTGRDLRFMVSADEVKGLQGWFIRRTGGFPIDTRHPRIASLRHGVEILRNGEMLVIFPEGGIFRDREVHPLKPGLARLALQAEASKPDLGVKIVPISLEYSQPFPGWRCKVRIKIGAPLPVDDYATGAPKTDAQKLTADLEQALKELVLSNQKSAEC